MRARAPLVVAVAVLATGIAIGAQRPVPPGTGPLLLFALLGATLLAARQTRPRPGPRPAGVLLLLLFGAGGVLGVTTRTRADRSCAGWLPDLPLTVRGTLLEVAGDRVRLRVDTVQLDSVRVPCTGVLAGRFEGSAPRAGTEVVGEGRWWRPSGPRRVEPVGLLLVDRLAPAVPVEAVGRDPGPFRPLVSARTGARRRVERVFGDRAPLAASLLLAQRDGLDREVRERFARAGLSHLLAISGLHVGLIAGILLLLTGALRLGKRKGAGLAALGTLGYVAFLGAPHSAARAALQIGMVLAARTLQRPARTEAVIAAAALALLVAEPAALFGPGFQLSFAGVAGILAFRRPLLGRLHRLAAVRVGGRRAGRWLADGLATSVAATVSTAPIVAWHFGRVAPIGVVANLVAIPLLSATVPTLALALLAGLVWVPAGRFLASAASVLLDGLDATASAAAAVPGGAVAVPASVALVLTVGAAIGYVASRRLGSTRGSVRGLIWAGVAGAVVAVSPVRPVVDRVEIHVIDVGQGDAIGIRSPAGRWLLVDAGVATDGYDAGARLVVPYLARRGVQRLEGLVITHPDADHMGGAASVIAALRPRWVLDPGMRAPKAGYLELLRRAASRGVPWSAARRGMELEIDGMVVEVLYPEEAVGSDDANDGSVVLRVVFGEFETLLTGDAPAAVELSLVQRHGRGLEADVLKVGHHGSVTSTSPELLTASGARLALISAGRGNRYGHPHRAVLRRLADAGLTIARTDRHGSLVVTGTRGGRVSLEATHGGLEP